MNTNETTIRNRTRKGGGRREGENKVNKRRGRSKTEEDM